MHIAAIFSEFPEAEHTLILDKVIGQGKFYVYHAKAPTLPEVDFALKVFSSNAAATIQFAREKHFLNRISHPNIVTYIPIFRHNLPHDFLATEYTPNGDFFDFVAQKGMSNNEKLMRTYFCQFIEGLEYLHAQGIAHLDLKLENLLIDKDFILKILDFDQAQISGDEELHSGGTIGYRAPELVNKAFRCLKALDIYAAGVLLYTFVTGEMPFAETKDAKVRKSSLYETFREDKKKFWREKSNDLNKTFSKELTDLLSGMWDEKVEKRMKVEQVKRSKWYNGEVYNKEELKTEMTKIFKRLRKN